MLTTYSTTSITKQNRISNQSLTIKCPILTNWSKQCWKTKRRKISLRNINWLSIKSSGKLFKIESKIVNLSNKEKKIKLIPSSTQSILLKMEVLLAIWQFNLTVRRYCPKIDPKAQSWWVQGQPTCCTWQEKHQWKRYKTQTLYSMAHQYLIFQKLPTQKTQSVPQPPTRDNHKKQIKSLRIYHNLHLKEFSTIYYKTRFTKILILKCYM